MVSEEWPSILTLFFYHSLAIITIYTCPPNSTEQWCYNICFCWHVSFTHSYMCFCWHVNFTYSNMCLCVSVLKLHAVSSSESHANWIGIIFFKDRTILYKKSIYSFSYIINIVLLHLWLLTRKICFQHPCCFLYTTVHFY